MQEFSEIQQTLQQRYDELRTRVQKISSDVQHKNEPLQADFAEQAVQRENDEVLDALDQTMRAEMQQIETSLQRLAAGSYGVCERCEEKIPVRRLEALPHANLCVACAETAQQNERY